MATDGCTLCSDGKTCYSSKMEKLDGCPCYTNLNVDECKAENDTSLVGCEWCSKDGAEPACHSSMSTMTCRDGTCATALPGHFGINCPCSLEGKWCLKDTGCCNNCTELREKNKAYILHMCGEPPRDWELLQKYKSCVDTWTADFSDCTFCEWKNTGGRCKKRAAFCAKEDEFCWQEGTCCDGLYCSGWNGAEGTLERIAKHWIATAATGLPLDFLFAGGDCSPKRENDQFCLMDKECKSGKCVYSEYDKGLFTCQDPVCRDRVERCGGYCAIPGITDWGSEPSPDGTDCSSNECDPAGGACRSNWTDGCFSTCASESFKNVAAIAGNYALQKGYETFVCSRVGAYLVEQVANILVKTVLGDMAGCDKFGEYVFGGFETWCTTQLQWATIGFNEECEASMLLITPELGGHIEIAYAFGAVLCPWLARNMASAACSQVTQPLVRACNKYVVEMAVELAEWTGADNIVPVEATIRTKDFLFQHLGCLKACVDDVDCNYEGKCVAGKCNYD